MKLRVMVSDVLEGSSVIKTETKRYLGWARKLLVTELNSLGRVVEVLLNLFNNKMYWDTREIDVFK